MSYLPPPEALITGCIDGCTSRVMWEYEPGDPQTYWHPGEPDYFTPVKGCSEQHLQRLVNDPFSPGYDGELVRQLEQWERLTEAAVISQRSSRRYLGPLIRDRFIDYTLRPRIQWEEL